MADMSIPRLWREWERLRIMHGLAGSPPEVDRLLLKSRRKQARLRDVTSRLTVLQAEADALAVEVAGLDKTIRHFLNDLISRVEVEHGPSWSPEEVLGFRVWTVRDGAFHGYRVRWEHRALTATCGSTNIEEGVPHTAGECSDPPCGIYASKDLGRLLEAHSGHDPESLAVGLVAMSGKVVEHEYGYRAEEVTVLALAFPRSGRVHATDDPDEIECLFQGLGLGPEWDGEPARSGGPGIVEEISRYMTRQIGEKKRWISGSPREL